MNLHGKHTASLYELFDSAWRNRELISQLAKREVVGRYRGSIMGLAWSFLNPILMLTVYTVFFSIVFKARWGGGGEQSHIDFGIILFVGLIVHGIFAECLNQAPGSMLHNVNYVKKIVFPLEILPWVSVISALFHAGISLFILVIAQILFNHSMSWTVIFLPLILLPFVMLVLGGSWFLASFGVYARDIRHIVTMLTTIMLFMSPVFFPLSRLPASLQPWLMLNPLTFIIEQSRGVLIYTKIPDWFGLGIYFAISLLVAWAGFSWFQATRKGFADVL